jgi:hypothetical protein
MLVDFFEDEGVHFFEIVVILVDGHNFQDDEQIRYEEVDIMT